MKTDAVFSQCRTYRYALWRNWDESKPYALFIGLNPSTADETQDDPTIRRRINYARDWGYGGLCMVNLFAFRATQPEVMKQAKNPVGPENDQWLQRLAKDAGVVVAAWGNDGGFNQRSSDIRKLVDNLCCLKLNRGGNLRTRSINRLLQNLWRCNPKFLASS